MSLTTRSASALFAAAATVLAAAPAGARDQIRIVGSSTVYPFATAVAEEFGRSSKFKTPIIESTGHRRRPEAVLRRRRRAAPGHHQRLAPDQAERGRSVRGERRQGDHRGEDRLRRDRDREREEVAALSSSRCSSSSSRSPSRFPRPGGELVANPNKTWKDVDAVAPEREDRSARPAAHLGHARRVQRARDRGRLQHLSRAEGARRTRTRRSYKSICLAVREDGAYVEAGENDNLIVQKLVANPNALGVFGYSFLEQNTDQIQGSIVGRRRADVREHRERQVPGVAAAVHLREERPREVDSGHPRVRGGVHQREGDRRRRLPRRARPDPGAEGGAREVPRRRQEPDRTEDDGGQIAPDARRADRACSCCSPRSPRSARGGFALARGRALAAAADGGARLHSLPGYYGWYGALWSALPGIAVIALWLAVAPSLLPSLALGSGAGAPAGPGAARAVLERRREPRARELRRRARDDAVRSTAQRYVALRERALTGALALTCCSGSRAARSRCAGSGPRSRRAYTSSASCAACCCSRRRSRSS